MVPDLKAFLDMAGRHSDRMGRDCPSRSFFVTTITTRDSLVIVRCQQCERQFPASEKALVRGQSWDLFATVQSLQQEGDRDCSVPVFERLSGIDRAVILQDLPQAREAKVTVSEWENWLKSKGYDVTRHKGDSYTLPCAHLVNADFAPHWIYQDEAGVHDPSPSSRYFPTDDPKLLNFSCYSGRELAISIKPRP
jgi:hypothetical protein